MCLFRCGLGEDFCAASCNAIGRRTGICSTKDETGEAYCECDTEYLTPEVLGDPEVTANLYCNFSYPYWEGCVICSIYLR